MVMDHYNFHAFFFKFIKKRFVINVSWILAILLVILRANDNAIVIAITKCTWNKLDNAKRSTCNHAMLHPTCHCIFATQINNDIYIILLYIQQHFRFQFRYVKVVFLTMIE